MILDKIYHYSPEFVKVLSSKSTFVFKSHALRRLYSLYVSPGDLVFDIGANVGDYSDLFVKMGARVISVEPQLNCVNKLKERFKNNKDIVIVPKGVGAKERKLPFYVSTRSHATSTFSKEWKEKSRFNGRVWDKKVEIMVTTLDSLIKKYGRPSFVKVDVEGYEEEVLKGLSKPVPALSIEFAMEYFDSAEKCIKRLMTMGNPQFNYIPFIGTRCSLKRWVTGGQLITHLKGKNKMYGGDIYVRFVH